MPEPLLQAVSLECERDSRLLFQNLSFSILPGTVTRVEGPNDAWSGELHWCGKPRDQNRESYLRNMLYLGHRPGIKPLLTPLENLRALMAGRRPVSDEVLLQALTGTGLSGFEHVACRNLS